MHKRGAFVGVGEHMLTQPSEHLARNADAERVPRVEHHVAAREVRIATSLVQQGPHAHALLREVEHQTRCGHGAAQLSHVRRQHVLDNLREGERTAVDRSHGHPLLDNSVTSAMPKSATCVRCMSDLRGYTQLRFGRHVSRWRQ